MEKSQETPSSIMIVVSQTLETEVKFKEPSEGQEIQPGFDVEGIISKMLALLIYSGLYVPVNFQPPYNRVHADIEYWKKRFETKLEKPEEDGLPKSE